MTTEPLPLGLLKIWCRMNDSWLSFKTHNKDRFLVNPLGYFIELPDGSFTEISPRMTFPLSDLSPCVDLDSLSVRSQFGDEARFVSVPMVVENAKEPVEIKVDTLRSAPLANLEFP